MKFLYNTISVLYYIVILYYYILYYYIILLYYVVFTIYNCDTVLGADIPQYIILSIYLFIESPSYLYQKYTTYF